MELIACLAKLVAWLDPSIPNNQRGMLGIEGLQCLSRVLYNSVTA